jgi:hypothetical protein
LDDLVAEGLMGTLISLTLGTVLCGVIGAVIGDRRGRRTQGLLLGLLFGPIGWIWVAALPSRKSSLQPVAAAPAPLATPAPRGIASGIPLRPCPACAREIPAAAVKCRHCGARSAAL